MVDTIKGPVVARVWEFLRKSFKINPYMVTEKALKQRVDSRIKVLNEGIRSRTASPAKQRAMLVEVKSLRFSRTAIGTDNLWKSVKDKPSRFSWKQSVNEVQFLRSNRGMSNNKLSQAMTWKFDRYFSSGSIKSAKRRY